MQYSSFAPIPCYAVVLMPHNVLQIGGRFNAANVLLALVTLRGIRNNLKTKI